MLKRLSYALILCALGSYELFSQAKTNNHFFLEGGGAAIIYSVNYERILTDYVGARVGYSFLPEDGTVNLVPLSVDLFYPIKSDHSLVAECDLGRTIVSFDKKVFGVISLSRSIRTAWVGVRLQSDKQGSTLRIGGMLIQSEATKKISPWVGVSAGKKF